MSLVRLEGFSNQLGADLTSTVGPFTWVAGTVNFIFINNGAFGGRAVGVGLGFTWPHGDLTTPLTECWMGVRVFLTPNVGAGDTGYEFIDKATNKIQITVLFNSMNGSISVSNDVGILFQTASNVVPSYTWFYSEIRYKVDSTNGVVQIKVNGVTKISLTGVKTRATGANNFWDRLSFGGSGIVGSTSGAFSEMYLCDTTVGAGSNPFNDFQGPVRVFTCYVTGNGDTISFTPLSGTNASQVDETQMDSDSSYNFNSGTVGLVDLFNMTDLPSDAVPLAVQVKGVYRNVSGSNSIGNVLKVGSSTNVGTSFTLTTLYRHQVAGNDVYPQNPDGNIPWTKTTVDASQIGYKIVS